MIVMVMMMVVMMMMMMMMTIIIIIVVVVIITVRGISAPPPWFPSPKPEHTKKRQDSKLVEFWPWPPLVTHYILRGLLAVLHFLLCLACEHLRKSCSDERNQSLGSDSVICEKAWAARWCFSGQNNRLKLNQNKTYVFFRYMIMFINLVLC